MKGFAYRIGFRVYTRFCFHFILAPSAFILSGVKDGE
jgi:hypothetical protein